MKIAVYAIAKNEAPHAARFCQSVVNEADVVVVADTGSTDGTVALLQDGGAHVVPIVVNPWSFGLARNIALSLVPSDVDWCVVLDIDEIMQPGWRDQVEAAIAANPTATRLSYSFIASHDAEGNPLVTFSRNLIHRRVGFTWHRRVHEMLVATGPDVAAWCDAVCEHFANGEGRPGYLPLLEAEYVADRTDPVTVHYLAREYYLQGQRDKAKRFFLEHLKLPRTAWVAQVAESMRYLADLEPLPSEARVTWLLQAVATDPYRRDHWVDLAEAYSAAGYPQGALYAATQALGLTNQFGGYISYAKAWSPLAQEIADWAKSRLGFKSSLTKMVRWANSKLGARK